MAINQVSARFAFSRLRSFFHRATPWQRALWGIGTPLALDEVIEYADIAQQSGESNRGLRYVASFLVRRIERDNGVGGKDLQELINTVLREIAGLKDGRRYPAETQLDQLREYARRIRRGYLMNWFGAMDSSDDIEPELTARCLGGFLLDEGFSNEILYGILNEVALKAVADGDEADQLRLFVAAVDGLHRAGEGDYEVLVPFRRMPGFHDGEGILDAKKAAVIIKQWKQPSVAKLSGALQIPVRAFDRWGAAAQASTVATRVGARVAVARSDSVRPEVFDHAFVLDQKGNSFRVRLEQPRRRGEIRNLIIRRRLYTTTTSEASMAFDDAVDLVANLESKSPGAAITGGWAAIESLLSRPGEADVGAADRAAHIATAAWPRAELTSLAYSKEKLQDDAFAEELAECNSSYKRARLMESKIRSGKTVSFEKAWDRAAYDRASRLLADPSGVLWRGHGYIASTFRRLYNQRNIIMHMGMLRSCALDATLRSAPMLVGATLDRVAFGLLKSPSTPALALAARAKNELELAGTPDGRWMVDLLA